MILDSTQIEGDTIILYMSELSLDAGKCYLVTYGYAGDGAPNQEELRGSIHRAVRPAADLRTLEKLVAYARWALTSRELDSPILLFPDDFDFAWAPEPLDPFFGGVQAFSRGLPFSANPYQEITEEFDLWDQGWIAGMEKQSETIAKESIKKAQEPASKRPRHGD